MKNFLQMLLLSIGLVGCSSIDYAELTAPVSPSNFQIDRILALNLSHEGSIIEANKLMDPALVSIVVKELESRKLKVENATIEAENVAIYAEMVKVSDDNLKFMGPRISDTKKRNMIGKAENLDFFLLGLKGNNGSIQHKLNFSITYTSNERRNYASASFCDKWGGCENENQMDVALISFKASGCSSFDCDYNEIVELDLSDSFLKENMEKGLSLDFNSKATISNKITIPSSYLKGYLKVAN